MGFRFGLDPEFQVSAGRSSCVFPKAVSAIGNFVVWYDFSAHDLFVLFFVLRGVWRRAAGLPWAEAAGMSPVLSVLRSLQSLVNIRLDIFHVFEADGKPDIIRRNAGFTLFLRRELLVGG